MIMLGNFIKVFLLILFLKSILQVHFQIHPLLYNLNIFCIFYHKKVYTQKHSRTYESFINYL